MQIIGHPGDLLTSPAAGYTAPPLVRAYESYFD
jgi:hypothetical protein